MRRGLLGAALFGAFTLSSPAFAEEPPTTEVPKAAEPEHAAPEHAEPEHAPAHPAEHATEADKAAATDDHHEGPAAHGAEHGAAHGEHGGEHAVIENWWSWDYGPNAKDPAHRHLPPPFGFALINFGIFAAIMMKLAGKPMREMVQNRHEEIRKGLEEAAKLQAAATRKLAEYGQKVKDVESEIAALVAQIRKEAEADKLRIIAAAEEQARKIKSDAERQIQAEIARASAELRRTVVEAAVASAEEILRKQIGSDDQRKMAEKYVTDVEKSGRPS